MRIVHGLPMEFLPMLSRVLTARRETTVVPLPVIQVVIHMPIKMVRSMEPRTRANKYTTRKPLRPIIPIRRAVIRRNLVISIRTNRRFADLHSNLSRGLIASR
jgi:hypothetical protein